MMKELQESLTSSSVANSDTRSIASSSRASVTSSGSKQHKPPLLDPNCLKQVEGEARLLASEYYKLSKHLQTELNQISAASVCCSQIYQESVSKVCDSVDESVKLESSLVKRANELSKSMEPVYELQAKISAIKTILSTLETQI